MDIGIVFLDFLHLIAIGAGTVLALILLIWLGLPRRSLIAVRRRTPENR